MGGKIIDTNGELIFEFDDDFPVPLMLAGLIQRAKFKDSLIESEVTLNQWVNDLLKALLDKETIIGELLEKHNPRIPKLAQAPQWHLDAGMTESDWGLQDFFSKFTIELIKILPREWPEWGFVERSEYIRMGIFPHEISNIRLQDMIQEIEDTLSYYSGKHNPDYSHAE